MEKYTQPVQKLDKHKKQSELSTVDRFECVDLCLSIATYQYNLFYTADCRKTKCRLRMMFRDVILNFYVHFILQWYSDVLLEQL